MNVFVGSENLIYSVVQDSESNISGIMYNYKLKVRYINTSEVIVYMCTVLQAYV